jgi:hypothetical protein
VDWVGTSIMPTSPATVRAWATDPKAARADKAATAKNLDDFMVVSFKNNQLTQVGGSLGFSLFLPTFPNRVSCVSCFQSWR